MTRFGRPTASRLAFLCTVVVVLVACGLDREPLRGDLVQDKGVMIGRGTFPDGTEWTVHARTRGPSLCTSPWVSQGVQPGGSCSAVAQDGWVGGMHVTGACGLPAFVDGSYDDSVASVRVESTAGVYEMPLVPLRAIGLPSFAFAWAAPPGAEIVSVTTLDASGASIARTEVPPNPACP